MSLPALVQSQRDMLACLRSIHQAQPLTRRGLAARTGFGLARVSSTVSQLLAQHLVLEGQLQDGGRGHPTGVLTMNPDMGRVLGLDIGGEVTRAVITDAAGGIVVSHSWPTEPVPDRELILQKIEDRVWAACLAAGCSPHQLLALGAAVEAIVDRRTGVVAAWPDTPAWMDAWIDVDLSAELRRRLDVGPVVVEDSVCAMGLNAHRFGPAQGRDNFLYLYVGNGIGAALFADGHPYRAATGISGELGHVTINEHGACSCGNRGCLETEAATPAVLRRVRERLAASHLDSALRAPLESGTLTIDALLQAAAAGDKIAYQILDETGEQIGRVLAIALNLFGPDLVIFAGPLVSPDSIVAEAMRRQVRLRALKHISRQTVIACDDHFELGAARGAALLALDSLITCDTYAELAVARLVGA